MGVKTPAGARNRIKGADCISLVWGTQRDLIFLRLLSNEIYSDRAEFELSPSLITT